MDYEAGRLLRADGTGQRRQWGTDTATVSITITDVAEDVDGTRDGAVSLGDQSRTGDGSSSVTSPSTRANGDEVDYYSFTTDGRYVLGLGIRDQSVELKVVLENTDGSIVGVAGPPKNPDLDQVYIEWLKTTIDAGTYYIRVEALGDGQTDYYIRFGLTRPRADNTEEPAYRDSRGDALESHTVGFVCHLLEQGSFPPCV